MAIVNGYCSLEQVRNELNMNFADADQDSMIELSIEAAARQIDGHCGRRFWQDGTVKTRQYVADDGYCVQVDDISTTTGLIVAVDGDNDGAFETTLTVSTDFLLLPLNAADETPVQPYTEIRAVGSSSYFPIYTNGRPGVQVTAQFGWPAVPDNVEKACVVQAVQLFKARDAAFGVATFGDLGGGLRVQAGLNPIAKALVAPYAHPAVG